MPPRKIISVYRVNRTTQTIGISSIELKESDSFRLPYRKQLFSVGAVAASGTVFAIKFEALTGKTHGGYVGIPKDTKVELVCRGIGNEPGGKWEYCRIEYHATKDREIGNIRIVNWRFEARLLESPENAIVASTPRMRHVYEIGPADSAPYRNHARVTRLYHRKLQQMLRRSGWSSITEPRGNPWSLRFRSRRSS